ncbi:MAG: hypothetical protein PWR03_379 [Tenuifilum sp.]|jgi:hypothetical protein|nr:hypothetical protein [Tenuifilum sp.]
MLPLFVFANNNVNKQKFFMEKARIQLFENAGFEKNFFEGTRESLVSNYFNEQEGKQCVIRYKVTITSADGTTYTVEGVLVVEGKTCTELIKEAIH